jgi:hypothetical protein
VAIADGITPVTTLTVSGADEAEALRAGTATLDISGATFAAVTGADGWYDLTLSTTATNTVGELLIVINDDSLILPLFAVFQVVEEAVYDALFAAGANAFSGAAGSTTLTALATGAITAAVIADGAIDTATFASGTTIPRVTLADVLTSNSDKTGYSLAAAGLDSVVIETGMNARQAMSVIASASAGVLAGAATTTVTIAAAGVSATNRVTATVDSSGNRSAVTLSLPS